MRLAQAYGYCWGVERAVQMAYEARKQYPGAKLHVTNEIIHNPAVNQVRPCLPLSMDKRCCALAATISPRSLSARRASQPCFMKRSAPRVILPAALDIGEGNKQVASLLRSR